MHAHDVSAQCVLGRERFRTNTTNIFRTSLRIFMSCQRAFVKKHLTTHVTLVVSLVSLHMLPHGGIAIKCDVTLGAVKLTMRFEMRLQITVTLEASAAYRTLKDVILLHYRMKLFLMRF